MDTMRQRSNFCRVCQETVRTNKLHSSFESTTMMELIWIKYLNNERTNYLRNHMIGTVKQEEIIIITH